MTWVLLCYCQEVSKNEFFVGGSRIYFLAQVGCRRDLPIMVIRVRSQFSCSLSATHCSQLLEATCFLLSLASFVCKARKDKLCSSHAFLLCFLFGHFFLILSSFDFKILDSLLAMDIPGRIFHFKGSRLAALIPSLKSLLLCKATHLHICSSNSTGKRPGSQNVLTDKCLLIFECFLPLKMTVPYDLTKYCYIAIFQI